MNMILELITPLLLATAPMSIAIPEEMKYSHQTQQIEQSYTAKVGAVSAWPTYGATQTYDATGRPRDNDND